MLIILTLVLRSSYPILLKMKHLLFFQTEITLAEMIVR